MHVKSSTATGGAMDRQRRTLLLGGLGVVALGALGAFGTLGWPRMAMAAETMLPAPESLKDSLAASIAHGNPLVVMVSLDGCPFCRAARQSYLLPLREEQKLDIVQIDMMSKRTVADFDGRATTQDALIRAWNIRVAPTVLFFGAGGKEAAPRLAGASIPDFYGAYLDQRIEQARASLPK